MEARRRRRWCAGLPRIHGRGLPLGPPYGGRGLSEDHGLAFSCFERSGRARQAALGGSFKLFPSRGC